MTKVRIKDDDGSFSLLRICDTLSNSAAAIRMVSDDTTDQGDMYCVLLNATMSQRPTHIHLMINGSALVTARVTRWCYHFHQYIMVVEWDHGSTALALRVETDQEVVILPPGAFAV